MGKKLSHHQSSLKISKNTERKSFSTLISALRPKVYITDSSSFKRLVQELTGNGSPIEPSEELPACEVGGECERSDPGSTDISEGCMWEQPIQEGAYRVPMGNQHQVMGNDQVLECSTSLEQGPDFAYHLLESWLLDTEHDQFCHGYDQLGLAANMYDYELLGQL